MKKILVAVDFSKNTAKVCDQAAALAKGLGAKVWIIHITSDQLQETAFKNTWGYGFAGEFISAPVSDLQMTRELCAKEYKEEHQALLSLSGKMRQEGVDARAVLMKGDAAGMILKLAEDIDADIIVMGSHGHGILRKALLGSITEAVLRDAFCNVLIVPKPAE